MPCKPSRLYTLLPLLTLLLGPTLLQAEEQRWYDVEVLLFVQQSQDYRASEQWPVDYLEPQLEGSRELLQRAPAGAGNKPIAFRRLQESELALSADAERIRRAPDLELLAHFGWRQPGLEPDQAEPVRITESLLLSPYPESAGGAEPLTDEERPLRLSGTLKLILSRYLHIETDLLYREPNPEAASTLLIPESEAEPAYRQPFQSGMTTEDGEIIEGDLFAQLAEQQAEPAPPPYHVYSMQQSRRMRSGELHYLDHPVFGLAIKVTPYKLEQ